MRFETLKLQLDTIVTDRTFQGRPKHSLITIGGELSFDPQTFCVVYEQWNGYLVLQKRRKTQIY